MCSVRPLALLAPFLVLSAGCSELSTPTAVNAPTGPVFITNGTPTGSDFGAVGALLYDFHDDGIDGNDLMCSGSLIAPTVFLTAAHCLDDLPAGGQVYVSFDPTLLPVPSPIIAAVEFHVPPGYTTIPASGPNAGGPPDLGVVILPAGSTSGIQPLQLPLAGYLDGLARKNGLRSQLFLNVGYGDSATPRGLPDFDFDGQRNVSQSPFKALTSTYLGLQTNASATGKGGDCYGDSGSPKFLNGNTALIVAVTSTGDVPCRATSWSYRLDTPSARAFLGAFVALP